MLDYLKGYVEEINFAELFKKKVHSLKKVTMLLVVQLPFEKIYLESAFKNFSQNELINTFENVVSNFFKPIFTIVTPQYDFLCVCSINRKLGSKTRFKEKLTQFENSLLEYFLDKLFTKMDYKNINVFPEIDDVYLNFAAGYSLLTSLDDVHLALNVAIERAMIRAKIKTVEFSDKFLDLVSSENFEICYYPIISVREKKVVAYEPKIVGPEGSGLEIPELLLKVAQYNELEKELDIFLIKKSVKDFLNLGGDTKLVINIRLQSSDYLQRLLSIIDLYDVPNDKVVFSLSSKKVANFNSEIYEYLADNKYGIMINIESFDIPLSIFKVVFYNPDTFVRVKKRLTYDLSLNVRKQEFIKKLNQCFSNVIIEGRDLSTFEIASKIDCKYYQGFCISPEDFPLFFGKDIDRLLNM